MKKNIIIGILTITTTCSLIFAYNQKRVADTAIRESIESKNQAENLMEMSRAQEVLAAQNYQRAKAEYDSLVLIRNSEKGD